MSPSRPQAAVAAGHPATVAAAAEVLRGGGNAVDAVLAAGFLAALAEPGLTSLGGGGFLVLDPPGGETEVLDFFVDAPGHGLPADALEPTLAAVTVRFAGADQVFHAGHGSVAVPGALAGYLHAHARHGRLPLAAVVAPTAHAAREGVLLNDAQAEVLGLLTGIVTLTPEAKGVFWPSGEPPKAGDLLRNPAYAEFLTAVADGSVTGFLDVAEPLLAEMATHRGLLTRDDLAAYRPVVRAPLRLPFGDAELVTNPPPSFGGTIVTDALAALDGHDGSAGEAARALVVALASATARQKERAVAQSVRGTTHVSVVDSDGLLAAMTTSNGSCSGVMVPGTGVQLNNVLGEEDLHPGGFHATPPGTRIGSMMAPSILRLADGSTVALGSGGSERIRSTLTQLVVHLARHGRSAHEAVLAPRLHWDGGRVQLEPGFPDAVVAALTAQHPVNVWSSRNLYFGGAQVVVRRPDGTAEAVGDPRRGGTASVLTG